MFFDTADMKPLVNNEAFRKALDLYKETTKYGPPDEINLDVGDTRSLFISGRCALSLDWGDIGTLAIDPATSKVIDKVGAIDPAGLEGGARPRHRQARRLRRPTPAPMPIDGVNHAPVRGVRRLGRRHQRQGRSQGEGRRLRLLLLHGAAGAVECRRDDRQDRLQPLPHLAVQGHCDHWTKAGMSEKAAKNYLGAIEASLDSPEHDPRPAHPAEPELPAGRARRRRSPRFLAGEIDKDATMKAIEDGWNELNDEIGKDDQLNAYKATIGAK